MTIIKESAPHIRKKASAWGMMLDVIIALLPIVIYSIVVYGLRAVMIIAIPLITMPLCEFIYVGLRNKMADDGEKHTFKEKFIYAYKGKYSLVNFVAPVLSALIFSMIMPVNATWYACFIGSIVGIVLGKLVFGGLGNNVFNPAAVGMAFAKIAFSSNYPEIVWSKYPMLDVSTGGTPLTSLGKGFSTYLADPANSVLNLFLGRVGGTLGEASALLILVGAVYLLIKRNADFRVMLSYLCGALALILASGLVICIVNPNNVGYFQYVFFQLLSGGLLFGAVFMITDPVTMPTTPPGRVMYGLTAGVLTMMIRLFAAVPEGVVFSILIANMFTPVFDYYQWSSSKFTLKKIITMVLIVVIPCIIMVLALIFNKEGFWYV